MEALNCGANFLVIKGGEENESSMAELVMAVKAMTERRMEEIALKRSLERFKRIYGELPVGIEIFDKDGVLVGPERRLQWRSWECRMPTRSRD